MELNGEREPSLRIHICRSFSHEPRSAKCIAVEVTSKPSIKNTKSIQTASMLLLIARNANYSRCRLECVQMKATCLESGRVFA